MVNCLTNHYLYRSSTVVQTRRDEWIDGLCCAVHQRPLLLLLLLLLFFFSVSRSRRDEIAIHPEQNVPGKKGEIVARCTQKLSTPIFGSKSSVTTRYVFFLKPLAPPPPKILCKRHVLVLGSCSGEKFFLHAAAAAAAQRRPSQRP